MERLVHKTPTPMIEDIEQNVMHGCLPAGVADPGRVNELMSTQNGIQIRAAILKDHQLAVHEGAGRQAAEHVQFGVTVAIIGPISAPEPYLALLHGCQGADTVPLHFKEVSERIKGERGSRKHGQYGIDHGVFLLEDRDF
jgi:hypothetical protein